MHEKKNPQKKAIAPYGTWPSPLNAQTLASGSIRFGEPKLTQEGIVWPESLPSEGGRTTLMYAQTSSDNNALTTEQLLPAPWDIRSKVHEYGGGAYAINEQQLFFVHADDQQIYRYALDKSSPPTRLTHSPESRYADLVLHPSGDWLLCVRESFHTTQHEHPSASIIAISTQQENYVIEIAQGEDFYASICLAPDGQKGAFISWNHPNMPWDNTSLWEFNWPTTQPEEPRRLINGEETQQSIVQPKYSPDNQLFFVSDLSNWWNLYRYEDNANLTPVIVSDSECATPQWTFGMSNWGFWDSNNVLLTETKDGCWSLSQYDLISHKKTIISVEQTVFSHLHCANQRATFLCGSPYAAAAPGYITNAQNALTASSIYKQNSPINEHDISAPVSHWFNTSKNERAHLWYYAPNNQHFCGDERQLPPLIILGHGGPTGATEAALNLKIQYWTNRGFAVADVNYRGSTGFGRKYRHRLNLNWGILDVDDLCLAAEYLVNSGLAHPQQKIIKGSSAGGFSVLAALTQHNTFDAGVSLYGIADLEALAKDTHKFEARYLDQLIGQYPEAKSEYIQRSPITHINGLNCPLMVAQGLEDKVVPPSQAELIVNAAKAKGIPVEYLTFENEGHGFRQPETIIRLFEAEHAFYCRTFNLTPSQ